MINTTCKTQGVKKQQSFESYLDHDGKRVDEGKTCRSTHPNPSEGGRSSQKGCSTCKVSKPWAIPLILFVHKKET